MIARWQEKETLDSLHYRRVVHLTGARQSGKTTLLNLLNLTADKRYSMDDPALRQVANDDPFEFTKRTSKAPMLIDEVQKVPVLLDAIKMHVDNDSDKGQFLLTGSTNLEFAKKIKESLAGRMHTVRLRTLTLGELLGNAPSFIEKAFNRNFTAPETPLTKRDILHLAFQGGYPECREFPKRARRQWFEDYLDQILSKDIQDVTEIRKLDKLKDVTRWILARSSKYFTIEDLCSASGISKPTAESYISALAAIYLLDKVPAWSKTDYDRIGKRPKYLAADTGLVANLLCWDEEQTYLDSDLSGKLIESWVYHELAALADTEGGYTITQFRDRYKREIDFMIENEHGSLLGIEVKAGANVCREDFQHLKWFGENLAKVPYTGIVLYSGENVLRFGEGYYAIPISSLGN